MDSGRALVGVYLESRKAVHAAEGLPGNQLNFFMNRV